MAFIRIHPIKFTLGKRFWRLKMTQQHWTNETPDQREDVQVTQTGEVEKRQEIVENVAMARNLKLSKITQFTWLLFGLLLALIALRVILKLIAANPASPFAALVYGVSDLFLWPFFGLTATPQAGGAIVEIPSIIAMVVYALVAWAIVKVLWLLFSRTNTTSVSTYERDRTIR
jgi:hypothetical protein